MINSDNGNIEEYLKLQNLLANIADDFLQTDSEKFDIKINQALKELGKFVHADRVYIFDYDFDKYTCSNTYEWCSEGIFPVINDLQDVPLDDISYWVDAHTKGEAVYIHDVMNLDINDGVRQILEPQGVLSLLAVPMMKKDQCLGFIGFDSVRTTHEYSDSDILFLKNFSKLLLSFIQNRELSKEIEKTKYKLDSILDTQIEFICRFNLERRVIYINNSMASLFNMTKDEIIGKDLFYIANLLYENNLEEVRKSFADLNKNNSYVAYTHASNGDDIWIEWSQYPVRSKNKSIIEYQIVGRDITNRIEAEESLKKEKQRLEYIIEASRLGVWEIKLSSGEMVVNDIYASMLGYTLDELPNLNFYSNSARVHPDDVNYRNDEFQEVLMNKKEFYEIECRYRHKNGSWVWIRDQGKIMSRSNNGRPLYMHGTHLDITNKKQVEEKIKNITHAIEQLQVGVIITNKDGVIEYTNPKISDITGYAKEELVGKKPNIFKSGEQDPIFYKIMWSEILSGNKWNGRLLNKRKNEELYWESLSISPVTDNKGTITNFIAIKEDISNKVKVEEVERLYKEQMDKFGENIPGCIYQYQIYPDGRTKFPMASKGIYEIYEFSPVDVVEDGAVVFSRIHPDDRDLVSRSIIDSAKNLTLWDFEYRVQLPVQGEKTIKGIAKPERLEDGSTLWHGYLHDVTERKILEDSLRNQEERYNLAIETTDAGVWDWDIINDTVALSKKWKTMLGYNEEEIEDSFNSWKNLWHPDDRAMISNALKNHLEGKSNKYEIVYRILHKDGNYRWVMTKGDIIWNDDGKPIRFIGTNIDISKYKEIESELITAQKLAEEASAAKSIFLSNITHEIRTPLNSIIGYTNLLDIDEDLNLVQKERVKSILISSEHLLSLVNEVLDMSKIESGRVEIEEEVFDINKIIDEIIIILKNQAEIKNIRFTTIKEQLSNSFVIGDMLKIRQILLNLGSNAIKFTNEGFVEILVSYELGSNNILRFCFSVKDTGIGIEDKDKPFVFEQFYHRSYNKNVGGTGLGLPISKKYAQLMGGNISFESTFKEGSTFTFVVNLKSHENHRKAVRKERITSVDNLQNHKNLLDNINLDHNKLMRIRDMIISGDVSQIQSELISIKISSYSLYNELKTILDDFDYQKAINLIDGLLLEGEVD